MGVLLLSKINAEDKFEVPFLKETIQWYKSGKLFHVIRLFILRQSNSFSGISIVLENPIVSALEKTDVLKSSDLLSMLKEKVSEDRKDGTYILDSYHYYPLDITLAWTNIGKFSFINIKPRKMNCIPKSCQYIAISFVAEAISKPYGKLNLLVFGGIYHNTHLLMPPTTVAVETLPIPEGSRDDVKNIEGLAVCVSRYEIWLATEGAIEASAVDASISPKRNRGFKGESVLEKYYGIPPIKRGWEIGFNYNKNDCYFNETIRCTFKHQKFYLVLAWVFGIATIAGFIISLL